MVETTAEQLARGEKVIYLGLRLGDHSERMSSGELEAAVRRGVLRAFDKLGTSAKRYPIFLPFRDCDQPPTSSDPDFYANIYAADLERLQRLHSLVAYLNDPCKDDGLCMEIGYAFAKAVPLILFVTDFHRYRIRGRDDLEFVADPVIERMAGQLHWMPGMPPANLAPSTEIGAMLRFIDEFDRRSSQAVRDLLDLAESMAFDMVVDPQPFLPRPVAPTEAHDIFVDAAGGNGDGALYFYDAVNDWAARVGCRVAFGLRFQPAAEAASIAALGEQDIARCLSAPIGLFHLDGPEADAGTSALQGMARAQGATVVSYYSGATELVNGPAASDRNLMLAFSADHAVRTREALWRALGQLLEDAPRR